MDLNKSILDEIDQNGEEIINIPETYDELGRFKKGEEAVERLIERYDGVEDLTLQILELLPIHYDKSGLWWVWSEAKKKWEIRDDVDILNLVKNSSGANVNTPKWRTEIINSLKQNGRMRRPEELPELCLQFKDEILDLETGRKVRATPRYFTTNPIPHSLGKSSETPTMDRIFTEWVGEEHVKLLYEILAYSMIPDYPLSRIFALIGGGSNGKSCYLNLLRNFIGVENVCSTELDTLLASRFEVTKLYKKLVCQMGETNFGEMSKTSMLKKLSGGDLIGFEYKNKTPFEAKNYAKIIIATNNLPATTDKTIGFYRRWLIVDFPNQFSEKKDILAEIPKEEYENLALKCVEILLNILKKREFTNEGSVEERMKKYEAKSNFLNSFLEEHTEQSINSHITKNDFKKKFADWCKANRHRDMSDVAIAKSMRNQGIEDGRVYMDWMNNGKGGQARAWIGIKWK